MVAVLGTKEKGYVVQRCNLGQLVFLSIPTAFYPRFLFPAVYPCISDTMSSYFPKLGLARVTGPGKERERNHRATPPIGAPPSGVESRIYVGLEISGRALDPISPSAIYR